MLALGFLRVGPVLDFRNGKEDINAIKSCVEIFTALTGKNVLTSSRASMASLGSLTFVLPCQNLKTLQILNHIQCCQR